MNSFTGKAKGLVVILGVNGQDGSYAAQYFLNENYNVVGFGRQKQSTWIDETKHFQYEEMDLTNFDRLNHKLEALDPCIIFNAAAIHGAANFNYESVWLETYNINVLLTQCVLEYIRKSNPTCFYLFLSSSKVFDIEKNKIISETTVRKSDCIYSITKNAATNIVDYYRETHDIKASVIWVFNHESYRRGNEYFISRILEILSKSIVSVNFKSHVYTLNFWCDWGSAEEYMAICGEIAILEKNKDFVLSSGSTVWAKDFVATLFSQYSLNYKNHIDEIGNSKIKTDKWSVDLSKLQKEIGKLPKVSINELCNQIMNKKYLDQVK